MGMYEEWEAMVGYYSDLHKDVHGFRPSNARSMSMEALERGIESLVEQDLMEQEQRKEWALEDAQRAYWTAQDREHEFSDAMETRIYGWKY